MIEYCEKALAVFEKMLGPEHPKAFREPGSFNNLQNKALTLKSFLKA